MIRGKTVPIFCQNIILNNCRYYEPREIKQSKDFELKIHSHNIRSLSNKITELRENLPYYSKFDVLCFNETNCNPETLPFKGSELELENFHPPFVQAPARESNLGGGLAIYVNKSLCDLSNIVIKDDISGARDATIGEFQTIEITFNGRKNAIICNYYRSPRGNLQSFMDKLDDMHEKLIRHRNKIISFTGDSNIDLLDYGRCDSATKLVDKFNEHGFAPLISRPTRITNHSATIIDHIFSNCCHAVTKSGIITETLSDHLATFCTILLDPNRISCKLQNDPLEHETRVITEENIANFEREIGEMDWNFLQNLETADEKYNAFETKYQQIYENHFPLRPKKKANRKNTKPWILEWLQDACDRKNSLYKDFVKSPTLGNELEYKKCKKFVNKHIKKAKCKY